MSDTRWVSYGMAAKVGVAVFVYQAQIVLNCALHDTLGVVRQNDDSTWSWWRWRSKFFPEWRGGEGVASSEHEARVTVLEGWL